MPSLFNKKSEKAAQSSAWHTNFRDYSSLPDTKIIRTSFFVNALLLLATGISALAFVYQEYSLSELEKQLQDTRVQIANTKTASSKSLNLFAQFQSEEQRINELEKFTKKQKISVSDLVVRLAQTKPQALVFGSITVNDTGAYIRGFAQGNAERATTAVSAYEKQLKEDSMLAQTFPSISMTNVNRDAQGDKLVFDIAMTFNTPKRK